MLECKDGGVWFKRYFMVLVCSMFIDNPQNGYVGAQMLYYFDNAMLECKDGGVWFKRYFMVLVCSMFIDNPQNGYVGAQMLYYFDNVFDIPHFNWCSFVMHTLMETSTDSSL
nr:uncharacterized protein LOC109167340 [Ipomoea trifida]